MDEAAAMMERLKEERGGGRLIDKLKDILS